MEIFARTRFSLREFLHANESFEATENMVVAKVLVELDQRKGFLDQINIPKSIYTYSQDLDYIDLHF